MTRDVGDHEHTLDGISPRASRRGPRREGEPIERSSNVGSPGGVVRGDAGNRVSVRGSTRWSTPKFSNSRRWGRGTPTGPWTTTMAPASWRTSRGRPSRRDRRYRKPTLATITPCASSSPWCARLTVRVPSGVTAIGDPRPMCPRAERRTSASTTVPFSAPFAETSSLTFIARRRWPPKARRL